MKWKIPLFKMYWDDEDVALVNDAIRSGMSWAGGPKIAEFEEKIAAYIGSEYCLTFNSGTSALHAVLLAHGIGKNDEVIVPSFTFIATANSPRFVGAKPVFADIDEETFGLDPASVEEKITKKTKAIMPVHYGGCPCRVRELREIADDHGILLIEDAAEAFGAKIGSKMVGTFGDSSMMSFCQNKIITTGEGGAILTDSRDLYEKMKLIRSHGRLETADYFSTTAVMDYIDLGFNFRISNITAALGIAQINKVKKIITMRRKDADYYNRNLTKTVPSPRCCLMEPPKGYHHVYQLYSARIQDRDALITHMEKKKIMTKIYFSPVHKTHYYKNVLKYTDELPVTDRIADEIISLPFYPGITREEMDAVVSGIAEFYR
jgi:perosamine synthetase